MTLLPNNFDAERNLLGSCLLETHIPQAARSLSVSDFYTPQHREIFRAFLEQDADGAEIDPFNTFEIFKRNNPTVAAASSVSEIVNTSLGMVHGVNERTFVNTIKDASRRRYLMREMEAATKALESDSVADVVAALKRKLDDLDVTETATGKFRSLAEILEKDVRPALDELSQGRTPKISTGFSTIDKAIGGGLSLSDLLLIAGLPGSGKSAWVLQSAFSMAKNGVPVAFLSGEMSDRENVFRILTQQSGITNLNSLQHIDSNELRDLNLWADHLQSMPMFFDSRTLDLQTVGQSVRALVENHGVKVLFVDYIQLLRLNKFEKHGRYERIAETSQEVKRLAMELGIAVVEVAQFNREGAKSGKPTMHDLEGSSQLEKDTSLIFILDRDPTNSNVSLRIEKGRNSGLCEIPGSYRGRVLTFEF